MAILGPLVFYLHWPYLWHHPVDRTAWYLAFHLTHNHYTWFYLGELLRPPPFPLAVRGERDGAHGAHVDLRADGVRLRLGRACARCSKQVDGLRVASCVANAVMSIALISHPNVPHFGGVKHWFPSMPFLAMLAAGSLERGANGLSQLAGAEAGRPPPSRGCWRAWRCCWARRRSSPPRASTSTAPAPTRSWRAGCPGAAIAGHAAAVLGEQPDGRAALAQRERAAGRAGVLPREPRRADPRQPAQRHAARGHRARWARPTRRTSPSTSTTRSSGSTEFNIWQAFGTHAPGLRAVRRRDAADRRLPARPPLRAAPPRV